MIGVFWGGKFLSATAAGREMRTQVKDLSELRTYLRNTYVLRMYNVGPSGPYFSGFLHKRPESKRAAALLYTTHSPR